MTPYKDYVQKRRTDDHEENVLFGLAVCIAIGALLGVMLGVSI